ncbi:MAG: hypothetical protein AAF732_11755 [Pseudomonadota bacterium]
MSGTLSLRLSPPLPEAIYWAVASTMAAAFVITLAVAVFDTRTIDGAVSVWAKPMKFELALSIHAATLALVMTALSDPTRSGAAMTIVAVVFLAACIVEMGYIIFQAAHGAHSHFNVSTPFHRFMWSMMALAAIAIVGAAAAVGVAAAVDSGNRLAPALKWAIALGLIGGTLLTLYTAFTIGARMSPYVGAVPAHDARMALTGWSLAGGDLRVSHFLATHMIQVLPLIGLAVAYVLPGRLGILVIVVTTLGWSAMTLAEYARALAGEPSPLARTLERGL